MSKKEELAPCANVIYLDGQMQFVEKFPGTSAERKKRLEDYYEKMVISSLHKKRFYFCDCINNKTDDDIV